MRCFAILFALIGSTRFLAAQPRQIVFLLPVGFKGWVCTDFGVPGAPPLPREGDALLIRARPGEVIKTSDQPIDDERSRDYFSGPVWWEDGSQRQPVPEPSMRRGGSASSRDTLDGHRVQQECAFFGTQTERDSVGEPPNDRAATAVSAEEREILVALYESTDGKHWKNNTGWLGPAGGECNWFGVECQPGLYGTTTIFELELNGNNLVGTIPEAVSKLNLDSINILGNHLSGMLPNAMIQRWLAHKLDAGADDSLLTNVSEIEFDVSLPALLCGSHWMTVRVDGTVALSTSACRNRNVKDRKTFCEVKQGRVYHQTFAKLAWLLDKNGFYDLAARYDRSVTDGGFETTRVTREGKRYEVSNYADSGPFELWVIQRALESIESIAEWESVTKIARCPGLK